MNKIPIYTIAKLAPQIKARLFNRSMIDLEKVKQEIKPLLDQVKIQGDQAILAKYASRKIPITSLKVTPVEFKRAQVSGAFKQALSLASANLSLVCEDQLKSINFSVTAPLPGISVWQKFIPLSSVGIYTPGGRANYPSSLMMCAIPAITAGVKQIVVCVPPKTDGTIPAEVLYTAQLLGISRVFKVGGPQAIAAMSYGTQSIPKVLKIIGPGNQYVNAAKLLVWPQTVIDNPAGPSENLIIADKSANPQWVAVDLMTDCEHGPDSTGILLTDSPTLAKTVQRLIGDKCTKLSAIIITENLAAAVTLANDYAPEHLQIMTRNAGTVANQITAAGSVFIGPWSAKAAGDYAVGANHVLPTGGSARQFGPLSVFDFLKLIEYQQINQAGFNQIKKTIETFAEVEGLARHKQSANIRNEIINRKEQYVI